MFVSRTGVHPEEEIDRSLLWSAFLLFVVVDCCLGPHFMALESIPDPLPLHTAHFNHQKTNGALGSRRGGWFEAELDFTKPLATREEQQAKQAIQAPTKPFKAPTTFCTVLTWHLSSFIAIGGHLLSQMIFGRGSGTETRGILRLNDWKNSNWWKRRPKKIQAKRHFKLRIKDFRNLKNGWQDPLKKRKLKRN